MRMRTGVSFIWLCAAVGAPAQQQPEPEGARELYYRAMVQKDPPPPVRRAAARSGGGAAAITPVSTEAMHLGLRYNLVLVDADSGRAQPAAPDRMFRAGECFAIELESNRAGFLYVLAKQSSGSWHPLIPSTESDMATESKQCDRAGKESSGSTSALLRAAEPAGRRDAVRGVIAGASRFL
jgi:hypothetical protein